MRARRWIMRTSAFFAMVMVGMVPMVSAIAQALDGPSYVGAKPPGAAAAAAGVAKEAGKGGLGVLPATGISVVGLIAVALGMIVIGRLLRNRNFGIDR